LNAPLSKPVSAYRFVGRFAIHVHPRGTVRDTELDAFLADMRGRGAALQIIVIWTDGDMTAKQRAATKRFQEQNPVQSIVFTDSAISRGIAKMLQWFGTKVDMHPKSEFLKGMANLGATRDEIGAVRSAIANMEAELGVHVPEHQSG
jgi:hypothetical protein